MNNIEIQKANAEWNTLIERLDQADIPPNPKWRTLVLYMRNISDVSFLSEKQKLQMQKLIVKTLKSKDFSEERYIDIVQKQEDILLGPHKEKIQMALSETQALLDDVRGLLLRKKGDVQELESTAVNLMESEANPKDMISSMRKAFHEVVNSMEQDVEDLTKLSLTDQLTQLSNRRAFDLSLKKAVDDAIEGRWPLSLVMVDIDHFKHFNDSYGHRIGDQALQVVATSLRTLGEQINASEKKLYHACRYGGEEFTIILPHTNGSSAVQVAEELRKRVEKCRLNIKDTSGKHLHKGLTITISLGVEELNPGWEGCCSSNLVEFADRKLYQAKQSGRNCVCHKINT